MKRGNMWGRVGLATIIGAVMAVGTAVCGESAEVDKPANYVVADDLDLCGKFDIGKFDKLAGKPAVLEKDNGTGMVDGHNLECAFATDRTSGTFDEYRLEFTATVNVDAEMAQDEYDELSDSKDSDAKSLNAPDGEWDEAERFEWGSPNAPNATMYARDGNLTLDITVYRDLEEHVGDEDWTVVADTAKQIIYILKK